MRSRTAFLFVLGVLSVPARAEDAPKPEVLQFRDGRAAARMGTYIQWLLDRLRAGADRAAALADAADRYAATWGRDKVIEFSPRR